MEGTIASSKRRKHSSMWGKSSILMCGIVVLILLACFVMLAFYHKEVVAGESQISAHSEYEALLQRAKVLTEKYKELTGSLPPDTPLSGVGSGSGISLNPVVSLRGQGPGDTYTSSSAAKVDKRMVKAYTKDLVLGMAQDTDAKNFVVFCKSLRRVSQADAIIFVNEPISERHKKIAEESHIQLVGFAVKDLEPSFLSAYHPSSLRWPLFHRYFQEHKLSEVYARIWMIDVRDSFFQSDPFAFVPVPSSVPSSEQKNSLHVFSGVESFPIKECGWNSGWVKDCFGPQMLAEIGSQGIICSGVSVGTAAAAAEYIGIMDSIITGQNNNNGGYGYVSTGDSAVKVKVVGKFPHCERNGVDQGTHNVLVHTGALDHLGLRKWSQSESASPVANMQARLAEVSCAGEGEERACRVLNKAGIPVAVVHQYDRYPDLQKYLFQKYVDWVKTGDLKAEWDFEESCRTSYAYEQDIDLFKGICDMPHQGGMTSASACCALCDARRSKGCQGFTFFSGACFFKSCGRAQQKGKTPTKLHGAVSGYLK